MRLFHVANVEDRASILAVGIDYRLCGVRSFGALVHPGNYLWDHLDDARSFACYKLDMEGEEIDIWAVDGTGLTLLGDPYYDGLASIEEIESLSGTAWICEEPVTASRLTLFDPAALEAA